VLLDALVTGERVQIQRRRVFETRRDLQALAASS